MCSPLSSYIDDFEPLLQLRFKTYWDARFAKEDVFDWFHGYDVFRDVIRDQVPTTSKILMIGCGNSKLSEDMYTDGFDVRATHLGRAI